MIDAATVGAGSPRNKPPPSWRSVRDSALEWVRLRKNASRRRHYGDPLSIADLFCGCGGLTLGMQEAARRAGREIDIRLAVDSDPATLAVYRANFCADSACYDRPVEELFDGPLSGRLTIREAKVAKKCGRIVVILAGPPCQGHSDLNNSTRRNDPRNRLYLRAARAVEVLRPKFAFIENVPSVVHDASDVVGVTTESLGKSGYHVTSAIVSFQDLGLPQRRRRHVLFASRLPGLSITALTPAELRGAKLSVGPFIKDLMDEPDSSHTLLARPARITPANRRRVEYLFKKDVDNLPDGLRPPCHRDKPHTYRSVYGRMYWSKPAQTITSGFGSMGQGRYVHPRRKRLITPHEAARIQGFPDFFDFERAGGLTALRTMIGNAVPPPLMISLVGRLLALELL